MAKDTVMKKIFIFCFAPMLFFGCADGDSGKLNYPYTIDHGDDYWNFGDQKNIVVALNFLKFFENGDISEATNVFADSVRWTFDYYDNKISRDTLKAQLTNFRSAVSNISIVVKDWQSIISKDLKQQNVLIWYTQIWEANGKKDSIFKMDDIALENGKIIALDEKYRHFHK